MDLPEAVLYGGLTGVAGHAFFKRAEPKVIDFLLSLAIGSALVFAFVLISGDSNQPTSVLEAGLATLTSLLAFLVGLSVSIVVYRLGPWHPLADYPGPVLAKLSKLWMGYCIVDGKRHLKLQELHEKYGPWLRIGPNELSVNIPAAVRPIYGQMFRAPFYKGAPQDADALITTIDRAEHDRRLVAWNKAFSSDSLQNFRPLVQARTTQLVEILHRESKAGKSVHLSKWISFWAMDVMGDISFSGGFETMAAGKDSERWAEMLRNGIAYVTILGQIPWTRALLAFLPVPSPILTYQQFAMRKVREAKQATSGVKKDILCIIQDESSGGPPLSEKEAAMDASLMVTAGTETVAQASMALFRQLAGDWAIQARVRQEINEAIDSEVDDMDAYTLGKLPYLDAVVQETLRFMPPVPSGPPRYSGEKGGPVLSRYVPSHTTISCPIWTLHHDARNFKDPELFKPERWLDITHNESHNLEAFIPFMYGPGFCIGKQIALQNMKLLAANIIRTFDLSFSSDFDAQKYDQSYKDYSIWMHDDLMVELKLHTRNACESGH